MIETGCEPIRKDDRANADASVFFCLWLQKPLRLSAETGSLTQSLVRTGCSPERIIALEREPSHVAVLRREFPTMTIIADDTTQIGEYLAGGIKRLAGVISSLPIKWFSVDAQYAVIRPCCDLIGPDGCFVQLTNVFSSPLTVDRLGIAGREVGRVRSIASHSPPISSSDSCWERGR